jgi:transposase
MRSMDQNTLFEVGLGLEAPWKVVRSGLEESGAQSKILYVDIDFEGGSKFPCPSCGKPCAVYDTEVKRWRHMNFWQHATFLSARVPRVNCAEHKVRQIEVPWARPGSGFTLMFEALVMALAREMPISALGALLGEHDTRLWRIVRHYVGEAHAAQDWSGIEAVAIDETATRKGQRYATVVVEIDLEIKRAARLIFMTPERTAASVGQFVEAMGAHGAIAQQVKIAALDMSAAYQKGVCEHLPEAKIVFDRFHVMKLGGDARDAVRKQLVAAGADLKGAMWVLRGNWETLKQEQREQRIELCTRYKALGRAMALYEGLQETWQWPDRKSAEIHLKDWCSWASRSRLTPFQKLARTIKSHWEGILGFFPNQVTSAAIEAINGIIQTARRRARGFRNFLNLRAICYWMAGHLILPIPSPFAHPI